MIVRIITVKNILVIPAKEKLCVIFGPLLISAVVNLMEHYGEMLLAKNTKLPVRGRKTLHF